MKLTLRRACAVAALIALAGPAQAQTYPTKPIRLIVPFPPGGGSDTMGRIIGQKLGERLGQQVVVDNRPGANGMIAMEMTAKSPPDGYTVVTGTTGAVSMNMVVYPKLPYDSLRDFVPISNVAESAFILSVHPSVPARNVQELVTLARTRAGQLTYSSFGVASSAHFGAELFAMMTGTKLVHVPYKGSAQAVAALLGGEVMFSFDSMQSTMPHIRAHRLRPQGLGAGNGVRAGVAVRHPRGRPGREAGRRR